eukprot:5953049-Amphidinium_carterae.1
MFSFLALLILILEGFETTNGLGNWSLRWSVVTFAAQVHGWITGSAATWYPSPPLIVGEACHCWFVGPIALPLGLPSERPSQPTAARCFQSQPSLGHPPAHRCDAPTVPAL